MGNKKMNKVGKWDEEVIWVIKDLIGGRSQMLFNGTDKSGNI